MMKPSCQGDCQNRMLDPVTDKLGGIVFVIVIAGRGDVLKEVDFLEGS